MNIQMQDIEQSTELYAALSRQLLGEVDRMEAEINHVRMKHLPFVRNLAEKVFSMRETLTGMIEEAPQLFVKPRTVIINGIKVGLQRGGEKVLLDDEEETIAKIKELYGPTATMLIKSTEKVMMQPLKNLTKDELELLGVTKVEGKDEALIKDPHLERAGSVIQNLLAQMGNGRETPQAQVIQLPAPARDVRQAA